MIIFFIGQNRRGYSNFAKQLLDKEINEGKKILFYDKYLEDEKILQLHNHINKNIMTKKMNYFGTDLNSPGHFIWDLSEDGTYLTNMNLKFKEIPFDPEEMPRIINGQGFPKGTVKFYHESGYSICAIQGSCSDTRGGTKSVFWIKESLTDDKLKELILSIPLFNKIIDKMPFEVKW